MHDSKKSAVRMCPFKMNPLSEGIFFYNVIECIESLQLNTQIHSEMNLKGVFSEGFSPKDFSLGIFKHEKGILTEGICSDSQRKALDKMNSFI